MTFSAALQHAVRGEVRFGAGDRALYAADSSNYRHVPRGVCLPRDIDDMIAAVGVCHDYDVPIVHRGGGTALAGQTVAPDALVIDSSKYCNRVVNIDRERRLATVEPGCVLDDLRAAAGAVGLTFGPDPATHNHCTLGGMIGNNSCGVHSVRAGRTLDNVHSLEILTADGTRMTVGKTGPDERQHKAQSPGREGEIYRQLWQLQQRYGDTIRARTPALPRLVSGYRLEQLLPENEFDVARALVGSESTCVTVLRATLELCEDLQRVLLVASYDDLFTAADTVPDILELEPVACEVMDRELVGYMRKKDFHTDALSTLPDGGAWLLIEAAASTDDEASTRAATMRDRISAMAATRSCDIVSDPARVADLWEIRKSGLGATAWVPGMARATWPGWEDSAVPVARIGDYSRALRALLDQYDYHAAMYGHLGDGLIHMRVDFGLESDRDVARFRQFMQEAAELVVDMGGSLSGEHGDGQARSELLGTMYGETLLRAFAEFKAIWDPDNLMNPGNIVEPRKMTDDLRFGPRFDPQTLIPVFNYPDDDGDFNHAAIRCVGVGECRRSSGGTMCPSYRATHEEKHSTRGRARLLQEMLQGDPIADGWQSAAVRSAMDLCLSCKACKTECPVNVDMATYKAEFLYHYYRHQRRPLIHHAMGNIASLAHLAGVAPGLANRLMGMPPMKRLLGIHGERRMPPFARKSFRKQWRAPIDGHRGHVILWTDTFNNYYTPEVLRATVEVLAQTGYAVDILDKQHCCGRPYYDFGMLDPARRQLQKIVAQMAPILTENTWVVGVEPSCIAVFKDELLNLYPDDATAQRLSQRTLMLGDFLADHTDYAPESIDRHVLVHGHCYHKTLLGDAADQHLLATSCDNLTVLDSGCCGMAGSFGYEREKYPLSIDIARQGLLPAINQRGVDDLVVANGFSCRSQLADVAGLRALTLPELLAGHWCQAHANRI